MNHLVIMLSMAIAMLAHPQPSNTLSCQPITKFTSCLHTSIDDDILSIQSIEDRKIEYIQIFDSSNQIKIETEGCGEATCQVDISTLTSGTYLCRITTPYGTCSDTFVK